MPLFRPGKPYRLLTLATAYAPGAGNQTVTFDTLAEDGDWDVSSTMQNTVVALDGLYLVTFGAGRSAPGSSVAWNVSLQKNTVQQSADIATAANATASGAGSWVGQLVAGDSLRVRVSDAGTGTLTNGRTHLEVVRIGPVRWT